MIIEKLTILTLLCMFTDATLGVIRQLNDTEYAMMPPKFFMDPYETCLNQPGGVYCSVDLTLVSDSPSPLLDMIEEYSAHKRKHFNYMEVYRGVCVSQNRQKYYENTTVGLKETLEAYLNDTFWNDYQLKTKISAKLSCKAAENSINLDKGDVAVAFICFVLVFVNVVGSLYDFYLTKGKSEEGIKLLLCFSLRRNWRDLVTIASRRPDSRLNRLNGFYGIRTIAIAMVIADHSMIIPIYCLDNPRVIEKTYEALTSYIIYNGMLVVQIFFIMSAFLLAYNLQLYVEKHKISWMYFPKRMIMRLLRLSMFLSPRLTPPYAIVLAFTCTWLRLAGSGPLWEKSVTEEVEDCRRYWWSHMLYINNFVKGSQCMAQTWYLAADFQMYCFSLLICVLCQSSRSKKIVLSLLILAGVLIPATQTYILDLDAIMIITPEFYRTFTEDSFFNTLYRNVHTNAACYVLGLGLGFLVYHWQKRGVDLQKYKKYRILYWALFPAGIGVILSGSVFYTDGPRSSVLIRAAYAGLAKLVFGTLIAGLIIGIIFKLENLYRGIVEWRGWSVTGEISYCAYLVHFAAIKYAIGIQTTTSHMSIIPILKAIIGINIISYVAACSLWLLVEAPFGHIVKMWFEPKKMAHGKKHQA